MPNRILKESICGSENLNKVSFQAEVLFYRLLVSADDFGRFDGRPGIIIGRCFPLKLEQVTTLDIVKWIEELQNQNLLTLYHVEDMTYLQIVRWSNHQQIRAKWSKYPAPDSNCKQMIAIDCNSPRNPNPNPNPNPLTNTNTIDSSNKKNCNRKCKTCPETSTCLEKYVRGKYGHMVQR